MPQPVRVTRSVQPKPKPKDWELGFGTVFTDHMFLANFHEDKGWYDARIEPYGPLPLDPAAAVLHYGQAIFEGIKAFRGVDGRVRLFRPEKYAERMTGSARRMCIPPLEAEFMVESIRSLVALDREWVPSTIGTSLYIRPTVVADEPFLGVRPARSYLYYVIMSPVGTYYPEGIAPVKILVADQHVRAVEGGIGGAKTGGNYAASLYASEEAKHEGFAQVLWLDGRQRKYLDEVGTMNIMVKIGEEVITPPLTGTILPGVTRNTVLVLLGEWNVPVTERSISIDEVLEAYRAHTLAEVFGTGTAAVISPVSELVYRKERMIINDHRIGPLAQRLYDAITDIHYGRGRDTRGWTVEA